MLRPIYRFLIFGAVLAGVLLVSGPQADAFWWRCCPPVSCCYSPCYTPCYTSCWSSCCDPCCDSSWVVGWRPGPIRRALFGRYRWYPGWGWYGYVSSYISEPCCSEVAMAPATPAAPMPPQDQKPTLAPKTPPAPTPARPLGDEELNKLMRPPESPAPKKATNPSTGDQTGRKDSGLLSLNVPDAARVLINGRETRAVGDRREFVSHGLKEGKVYPYTIRALVQAKGSDTASVDGSRWVWITKTVYLRAGDQIRVTFSENLDLERQLAQVEPASIR
jgi:uncharacterized protein (TIGR03000 family)